MRARIEGGDGPATSKRPLALKALIVAMLALVLLALPTGVLLISDPSGKVIGGDVILPVITGSLTFIHDFTLIGAWLLAVYGLLPLALAFGLLRRDRLAWYITVLLGFTVIAWIGVEIALFYSLGFTPMYPLIGGIGLAMTTLSLLPSVRSYYVRGGPSRL